MEAHLAGPDVSLNDGPGHGDGDQLQDFIADEWPLPEEQVAEASETRRRAAWLKSALGQISPCERRIFSRRFLAERWSTLAGIGLDLGVSKERARQIEARALAKLCGAFIE